MTQTDTDINIVEKFAGVGPSKQIDVVIVVGS